ncbi:hypothetical protein SBRY_90224 [Actinacidiphila bryophytorum]|uniref:Uncharacterized protein n=1 Tax=Actinacidiphila bryophytorum TaxID=1436133 RepID=A0A9W4MLB7_9ACTN|nr:hypothetical protein SBRY_90224 [Actinacidiphila bryophytorum]
MSARLRNIARENEQIVAEGGYRGPAGQWVDPRPRWPRRRGAPGFSARTPCRCRRSRRGRARAARSPLRTASPPRGG